MSIKALEVKKLPKALSLKKLIGPSFIILGLGLGSGEVVLWPSLASKYGMGIIWGALLGLTFQFFMNMEIERYALAHGESVFVGFARKVKWLPVWFLLSTFLPWIWPGIVAASATLLGSLFGIENTQYLAIGLLILMGLILSLGPVLYKTVEGLQKLLIGVGVPVIFILSVVIAKQSDWIALTRGIVGIGEGFNFLPVGIPIASFLAALAYAGAGGNLNLAQSFYIKAKGYGMGKYAGRITSLITGKKSPQTSLTGAKFECNEEELNCFKMWWKNINTEHFIVFWITGSVTILLLALLSYATTFNTSYDVSGINFVLAEATEIGKQMFPIAGTFFLIITGMTLFGTQLTVFDATSRILTENLILSNSKRFSENNMSKFYYAVLWTQIAGGIIILLFGFTQPLALLTLAAVLNAFAMFVHVGLTLWLNKTSLAKEIRPKLARTLAMILAFLFYGGFSIYTIIDKIF
jgi:hypothetical protein